MKAETWTKYEMTMKSIEKWFYRTDLLCGGAGLGVLDGRLGEDGEDLCDASVRDPDLGAVEDVVLAVLAQLGAGLDGTFDNRSLWNLL